jgi:hypothetical protein
VAADGLVDVGGGFPLSESVRVSAAVLAGVALVVPAVVLVKLPSSNETIPPFGYPLVFDTIVHETIPIPVLVPPGSIETEIVTDGG